MRASLSVSKRVYCFRGVGSGKPSFCFQLCAHCVSPHHQTPDRHSSQCLIFLSYMQVTVLRRRKNLFLHFTEVIVALEKSRECCFGEDRVDHVTLGHMTGQDGVKTPHQRARLASGSIRSELRHGDFLTRTVLECGRRAPHEVFRDTEGMHTVFSASYE